MIPVTNPTSKIVGTMLKTKAIRTKLIPLTRRINHDNQKNITFQNILQNHRLVVTPSTLAQGQAPHHKRMASQAWHPRHLDRSACLGWESPSRGGVLRRFGNISRSSLFALFMLLTWVSIIFPEMFYWHTRL